MKHITFVGLCGVPGDDNSAAFDIESGAQKSEAERSMPKTNTALAFPVYPKRNVQ